MPPINRTAIVFDIFVNMFKDLLAPNTYLSMEGDIILALKIEK